jgi:GntR family transcriptional regulator, arabinose operon transcriptional repressor
MHRMDTRLLTLDLRRDSAEPKHERLKNHFISEMLAGRLKSGYAIPTELALVKKLGVSRATVRQAMASLENDGLIRRVQGKGTFVDEDARRKLRPGLDLLALIVPQTRVGFYPSLLHGFQDAASEIQHQTIICNTDDDVGRQADILMQLMDKKVGGVALNPTNPQPTPAHQIRLLQEHGIPVVLCHRGVEGITAPLLAIPFREMGHLAGKALADCGHRRVAFFTATRSPSAAAYEEEFREAIQAGDRDVSVQSVHTGDLLVHAGDLTALKEESVWKAKEESVWKTLQEVFAGTDRPTAIFSTFDAQAETIYMLLPRLGLRVPEDVSLISVGGAWREGVVTRRLTSVVIDEIETGRRAVSLLHEMRRGDRPIDDNEQIVLKASLYKGETLAAPASASP